MAILNVARISAVRFSEDTTVTAPDGNTFVALSGIPQGVPYGSTELTVSSTTPVECMEAGSHLKRSSGEFVQVFTTDYVRTPV